MLKHVHSTSGSRSSCSTPVMGGAGGVVLVMAPGAAVQRRFSDASLVSTSSYSSRSSCFGCRRRDSACSSASVSRGVIREEEFDGRGPRLSAASSYSTLNRYVAAALDSGCPSTASPSSSSSPNSSFDSSSSSSSSSTSSSTKTTTTTVKIYAACLRTDVQYKTLCVTYSTTCREVVETLLRKCKMKHRDPNLFYLTMEVWVKNNANVPVRTRIALDPDSRPAELLLCRPRCWSMGSGGVGCCKGNQRHSGGGGGGGGGDGNESRFYLETRNGGLVRIHDDAVVPGSRYKSLLLSERTTCDEAIRLMLNCYDPPLPPSADDYSSFALYENCPATGFERKLHGDDCPLPIVQSWSSSSSKTERVLRIKPVRNDADGACVDEDGRCGVVTPKQPPPPAPAPPDPPPRARKTSWTRSLDFSSSFALATPPPSRSDSALSTATTPSPSSSVSSISGSPSSSSYRNYENYFYI